MHKILAYLAQQARQPSVLSFTLLCTSWFSTQILTTKTDRPILRHPLAHEHLKTIKTLSQLVDVISVTICHSTKYIMELFPLLTD